MHNILPLKLQRLVIKECELFLLNYVDMSLGRKSMITLLVREDANFYKVPLIKYDSSFETNTDQAEIIIDAATGNKPA